MLCPLPPLASGSVGIDCSLSGTVCPSLCWVRSQRGSPRDPRRVKEARECWNRGSTQRTAPVYKRLWKHQHLQESRKKTLHSEQLQSARDCWSRSISKRGKCQERRFYTAAKAQSTRDCRRVNISKGDKKEDSTQQPKLSLQETAEE